MTLLDFYTTVGGDYDEAKRRLLKDERIIRFLLLFGADSSMKELEASAASGDIETAFRSAHTIKGVAANLSLTKLSSAASALTEQLRPRKEQPDPALLLRVREAHKEVIDALAQLQTT